MGGGRHGEPPRELAASSPRDRGGGGGDGEEATPAAGRARRRARRAGAAPSPPRCSRCWRRGRGASGLAVESGESSTGLRQAPEATASFQAAQRRSVVLRSGLSLQIVQGGRWGGVLKQGRGHFPPVVRPSGAVRSTPSGTPSTSERTSASALAFIALCADTRPGRVSGRVSARGG